MGTVGAAAASYPTVKNVRWLLVGLAMVTLVAGCGDDDDDLVVGSDLEPPAGDPHFEGTLTSVSPFVPVTDDCVDGSDLDPDGSVSSDDPPICTDPSNTTLGSVLLEERPGVQEGDKISLRVDGDTIVLRRVDGEFDSISFDNISEGDTAQAWVFGPVAESYPMQASADALVLT